MTRTRHRRWAPHRLTGSHHEQRYRSTGPATVQIRVRDGHRGRCGAARFERGDHSAHLAEEARAGVDARVAAQGLPELVENARAALVPRELWTHRLPGD